MNAITPLKSLHPPDTDLAAVDAAGLDGWLKEAPASAVIGAALGRYGDKFALVSSFGSESAVLLHIASQVSKDIPILFLDTGKLFGETKRYRDALIDRLGFTDVRSLSPDADDLAQADPKGHLWNSDNNRCCFIRKVKPLHKVLQGFDAWASGRKRFQGGERELISHFESEDGRVKVNPLAFWTSEDVKAHMEEYDLPQHPLVSEGFRSIGCMPCTSRVEDGEADRDGRWRGQDKIECGIHKSWAQNVELFDQGGGI